MTTKRARWLVVSGVLLLALMAVPELSAQWAVGVWAGGNNMTLSGDKPDKADYQSRSGFSLAAHFELAVASGVAVMIQPGYSSRGSKVAFQVASDQDPVDSLELKLDYFSLPAMLRVDGGSGKFYATIGVDLSFLSSASLATGSEELDLKQAVTDIDLAAAFGVGGKFSIGRPNLLVELRYKQSLLNLADSDVIQVNGLPARFRLSGLELWAGVVLPLGGAR